MTNFLLQCQQNKVLVFAIVSITFLPNLPNIHFFSSCSAFLLRIQSLKVMVHLIVIYNQTNQSDHQVLVLETFLLDLKFTNRSSSIAAIIITEPGVMMLSAQKQNYPDSVSEIGCIGEQRLRSRCQPVCRSGYARTHNGLTSADTFQKYNLSRFVLLSTQTCQIYFEYKHYLACCSIIKMSQYLNIQSQLKRRQADKIYQQKIQENSKEIISWQKKNDEQKLQNEQLIGQQRVKQKSQAQQYLEPDNQVEKFQPTKKLKPGQTSLIGSQIHLKYMKEAIVSEVRQELIALREEQKVQKKQYQEKVAEKLEQACRDLIQQKIKQQQSLNIKQQTYQKNLMFKFMEYLDKLNKNLQRLQKKVDRLSSGLP